MTSAPRPVNFRLDFRFVPVTNEDGTIEITSIPDPDRYERIFHKGRWHLGDRYTRALFDEEMVLKAAVEALKRLPMRYEPSQISDQHHYVIDRAPAIESMLSGEGASMTIASRSHETLLANLGANRAYAVVTVDVHNHVELAHLERQTLEAINTTLSHELGLAAALHNGHLWRSSSTSQSFFFPAPNLITKSDLALGFATTARDLITLINARIAASGAAALRSGIGVEAGEAAAQVTGVDEIHTELGLVGLVVAAAEEIARHAHAGAVWIGPKAADICHVSWRKLMMAVEPQPEISLLNGFDQAGAIWQLPPDAYGTGPLLHDDANPV